MLAVIDKGDITARHMLTQAITTNQHDILHTSHYIRMSQSKQELAHLWLTHVNSQKPDSS